MGESRKIHYFSLILLIVLDVVYMTIGGMILAYLEKDNCVIADIASNELKNVYIDLLRNSAFDEEKFPQKLDEYVYQAKIAIEKNETLCWEDRSALYYAYNLATFTGYDEVQCESISCRLFTVVYGLCGILLTSAMLLIFADSCRKFFQFHVCPARHLSTSQRIVITLLLLMSLYLFGFVFPTLMILSLQTDVDHDEAMELIVGVHYKMFLFMSTTFSPTQEFFKSEKLRFFLVIYRVFIIGLACSFLSWIKAFIDSAATSSTKKPSVNKPGSHVKPSIHENKLSNISETSFKKANGIHPLKIANNEPKVSIDRGFSFGKESPPIAIEEEADVNTHF